MDLIDLLIVAAVCIASIFYLVVTFEILRVEKNWHWPSFGRFAFLGIIGLWLLTHL